MSLNQQLQPCNVIQVHLTLIFCSFIRLSNTRSMTSFSGFTFKLFRKFEYEFSDTEAVVLFLFLPNSMTSLKIV